MRRHSTTPADRLRRECLGVAAPDARVSRAVADAAIAVDRFAAAPASGAGARTAPGRPPVSNPYSEEELAWIGMAGLAIGAHDAARALLEEMGAGIAASHSPVARRLYLVFVARFLAWTGDAPLVTALHLPRIRHVFEALPPPPAARPGIAVRAPAAAPWDALLGELAETAEAVGDAALTAAARDRATAGAWQAAGATDAAALLPGAPGGVAWTAFVLGRPGLGARHWRALLGPDTGAESPAGAGAARSDARVDDEVRDAGAEPPPQRLRDRALDAAAIVLPLVHGLLGVTPDAPRHRLVMRTRFPADWDDAEVRRLTVGDCAITLRFEADRNMVRFRLEQETGAVPVRTVLAPELPAGRLAAALVDGRAAELDVQPAGERIAAPVQIVLDHERSVEFHVAADDDALAT